MRLSTDAWVLIVLFVLLLIGGYLAASPPDHKPSNVSSSYSSDPKGVKAFYTLLGERLGYRADRLREPYTALPSAADVLVVVQPSHNSQERGEVITPAETQALRRWVSRGGIAVFLSDKLANVPQEFRADGKIGSGHVYAFDSRRLVTNEGVRDYRSPLPVLGAIASHTRPGDRVLFDEYHHGLTRSDLSAMYSQIGRHVKVAFWVLLAAALILVHTRGRRFGSVRGLPAQEQTRPGFEFVESVARIYERAHAGGLAADILCESFKLSLCSKLGLSADAARSRVTSLLIASVGKDTAERVDGLLARCDAPEAGHRLSGPELLHIARDIQQLEKELGLVPINA